MATPVASMQALLEAGAHFGNQTHRWNPKMKPYIFGDRNGVHILDPETTLGLPIADAMKLGELILDVAVTANRPDALSAIGIARELATAIPGLTLKKPTPKVVTGSGTGAVKLGAVDFERAPYYAGLNVVGVKVGPSPEWLVKRLSRRGIAGPAKARLAIAVLSHADERS